MKKINDGNGNFGGSAVHLRDGSGRGGHGYG